MKSLILLVTFSLSCVLFAGDLTTVGGKTYYGVRITRVEPDGISIIHRDGVAKIPFSDLSEEARDGYGYDSQKAAAYAKQRQEQAAAYAAAAAKAEQDKSKKAVIEKLRTAGLPSSVVISQVLPDGILGEGTFFADAGYKTHWEDGSTRPAGTFQGLGFIFVRTPTKGLADGETWSGTLWAAGTYRYEAVSGAGKTVRQYVTSPEEALAILAQEKTDRR